jgi:hypothetical protein
MCPKLYRSLDSVCPRQPLNWRKISITLIYPALGQFSMSVIACLQHLSRLSISRTVGGQDDSDSASFRLSSVLEENDDRIARLEQVQCKDKTMTNNRTKTLWLPALVSLIGSMSWRFMLQRSFPQSQPLLNHAGLPLTYQLLWLAALPIVGAFSVYLSRRAGGDKLTGLMAALSPSIVMIPLWLALATKMSHPSPRQWFGLLCGVLNWIVTPGIALSLGAWPLLRTRTPKNTGNITH